MKKRGQKVIITRKVLTKPSNLTLVNGKNTFVKLFGTLDANIIFFGKKSGKKLVGKSFLRMGKMEQKDDCQAIGG